MEGLQVLIVDDERDIGEFVADALESLGHEPTNAGDKEAFSKAFDDGVDVVMLDLFMPDADGIELLRILHASETGVPVIFMSGKDRSILNAAQRLAMDQGVPVLGTLQKPFTVDELADVIGRYGAVVGNKNKTARFKPTKEDILHGLAEGQFSLIVRPQARLDTGAIIGGEAALRWDHPVRGEIRPDGFMTDAEAGGAYNDLIDFTVVQMVRQLASWNERGDHLRLSIRLTPGSLADLGLAEELERLVRAENVNAGQVVVDLPEAYLEGDIGDHIDLLTRLRIKGFILSIDKFGTGRISLRQLARVPFNEVKLHRSIVENMARDPETRNFARLTILIAHELGMRVVAAGVRNRQELDALADMRCDTVQGEVVGGPIDAAQLPALAKRADVFAR